MRDGQVFSIREAQGDPLLLRDCDGEELLRIRPDGEVVLGDGVSLGYIARELAELLVGALARSSRDTSDREDAEEAARRGPLNCGKTEE